MYSKVLNNELNTFPEHELIEILLYFVEPRKNTNDLAHDILKFCGSIRKMLDYTYEDLQSKFNLTDRAATFFKILLHFSNLARLSNIPELKKITSTSVACEHVKTLFLNDLFETIYIVCLNAQNEVTKNEKIHEGPVNAAQLMLRKMISVITYNKSTSIIIAHNHPSGTLKPSNTDIESTKVIINSLKPFGIKVLDHIIVSGNDCYSFRTHNLLFASNGYNF